MRNIFVCVPMHHPDLLFAAVLQACKVLVTRRGVGRDDELILESVLGEGSYGKVSDRVLTATWPWVLLCVSMQSLPVACLLGSDVVRADVYASPSPLA